MKALRRSNTSSSSTSSPSSSSSSPPSSSWIHLRSLLVVASSSSSSSASSPVPDRGSLKSPWSRRKRKRALSRRQWYSLFSANGRLRDGGVKFLKKVRSGGIEPSIRAEVWPFLLGVYDLDSSEAERNIIKIKKRKEYEKLRRHCQQLLVHYKKGNGLKVIDELSSEESPGFSEGLESPGFEDLGSCASIPTEEVSPQDCEVDPSVVGKAAASNLFTEEDKSGITYVDSYAAETESSDSESSDEEDPESIALSSIERSSDHDLTYTRSASFKVDFFNSNRTSEDFATWQRIIRLDAIRVDAEWILHSPHQATISEEKALQAALSVGLKDYDHLEPCMIYHAARLVAVLEAYAVYDPEIGYCQGMSDLLSPIAAVVEEDHEAFWCFVGFMRKARHNFRLDEVGIRRQLKIVSKIIKCKDSHLYRHLEKLQAEDCFFVYRMVVVLFRRELTFEQTVCLWEVMWADQAAIRTGIGKSAWGRIMLRAPPTDDLLLYAIAACVLQRRKLIIEKYSSMDEILRECNSMAGQLDVWRLLDNAHDLVVNLHQKI
ncbi:rab GTPase-activating protein 22-like isoform X1 [Typha angustifolia]|uniref:rab GTPase-activating protein 22-like isoform X1 n=1 Tax=Typha angustifolia TaxID=59011 RepID=UPI003C30097B